MIRLRKASPDTIDYNCIAWAAEDNTKRWDPDPWGIYYWPETVPRRSSIQAVVAAYESIGYKVCDNTGIESGFKKIAIYADSLDMPKHVARQLPDGEWTSKLGDGVDVEHPFVTIWERAIMQMMPIDLSSYGRLVKIMKKPC